MHPLAEAEAVALLLQHPSGWVHVYSDGSSRWSAGAPDPGHYWNPADVPEPIACQKLNYRQARNAFAAALKRMRARGVVIG